MPKRAPVVCFPLQATFRVVWIRNKLRLRLIQERDGQGVVRPGRDVYHIRSDPTFEWLSANLFAAVGESRTCMQVFDLDAARLMYMYQHSLHIVAMGGHYNGECHVFSGQEDKGGLVDPTHLAFSVGQVVEISGYADPLGREFYLKPPFAQR